MEKITKKRFMLVGLIVVCWIFLSDLTKIAPLGISNFLVGETMYSWQYVKTYPLSHVSISQSWSTLEFFGPAGDMGTITLEKDEKNKIIYFQYHETKDIYQSRYKFSAVWFEGYIPCYKNIFTDYCFNVIK